MSLVDVGGWNLDEFPWMPDGGASASQMTDGAEVDARADMIDDFGGEVGILFGVVDQEGDLGQDDSFARHRKAGRRRKPLAKKFKHGKPFEKKSFAGNLREQWIP